MNATAPAQLVMTRDNLNGLPFAHLPAGYYQRCQSRGDETRWEELVTRAFDAAPGTYSFTDYLASHESYSPENVVYICKGRTPVATSSVQLRPEYGPHTGYLHMVAVDPDHAGHGLGKAASLICLHRMKQLGCTRALLRTDDHRLPAIHTYFKLGFTPFLVQEGQRDRWRVVFEQLNGAELAATMTELLREPVLSPDTHR